MVQRNLCLASRSGSPNNESAAKCEFPIMTFGVQNNVNPLQDKGDRLTQNLQRAPFILSQIAAVLSDIELHPPGYPVRDAQERPVYEALILHK